MKCENMNNGERPIVLFIFAYQIFMNLMNLKMKATPKGRGLPHVKNCEAGTSASEKENGRGLPQEKEKNGRGLPQEKKKRMAGTPAKEKEMYMAGTPANE